MIPQYVFRLKTSRSITHSRDVVSAVYAHHSFLSPPQSYLVFIPSFLESHGTLNNGLQSSHNFRLPIFSLAILTCLPHKQIIHH